MSQLLQEAENKKKFDDIANVLIGFHERLQILEEYGLPNEHTFKKMLEKMEKIEQTFDKFTLKIEKIFVGFEMSEQHIKDMQIELLNEIKLIRNELNLE